MYACTTMDSSSARRLPRSPYRRQVGQDTRMNDSGSAAAMTIADLGEFGLIDALTADRADGPAVLVGPGDDAAQVATPGGSALVSTDTLVAGRHFRMDWFSAYSAGSSAAAANSCALAH